MALVVACGGERPSASDAGPAAGQGGSSGSAGSGSGGTAGAGGAAPDAGVGGAGGEGGTQPALDASTEDSATPELEPWPPLESSATPRCTHAPAPAGFEPAALGVFSVNDADVVAAIGVEGTAVVLQCPGEAASRDAALSSDQRKIQFYLADRTPVVTSWLLEGVYELPQEAEGFKFLNMFWLNADFFLSLGERTEEGSSAVVERAMFVFRWDGTDITRLEPALRLDPFEASDHYFVGVNERFGVFRFDATEGGGFEFYRFDFDTLESTPLASGIGDGRPVVNPFHAESGRLLLSGDGMGIDVYYALDAASGELTELDAHSGETELSADGLYAVWRDAGGYKSQALDAPASEARSYDVADPNSLLQFERDGHRFTATTAEHGIVVGDPQDGSVSAVPTPPVALGAAGVTELVFAPDGKGLFFHATLEVDGASGVYYAPLAGPSILLSPEGVNVTASLQAISPDGQHVVYRDASALFLVSRDGDTQTIPGGAGAQLVSGWMRDRRSLLFHGAPPSEAGGPQRMFMWEVGASQAIDIFEGAAADLGGPITGSSATFGLVR